MSDIHINKRILEKINALDKEDEFKKMLKESLIFEKDQFNLGENEYTKKYDGLVAIFRGSSK